MTDKNLYTSYVAYAEFSRMSRGRNSKSPLSKQEFLDAWNSVSDAERSRWAYRFKLGHQAIIKEESARYAEALTSGKRLSSKAA